MSTSTTHYGFTTFSESDGASANFLDFRLALAGADEGANQNTWKTDSLIWQRQTEAINRKLYYIPLQSAGALDTGGYINASPIIVIEPSTTFNSFYGTTYSQDARYIFQFPDNAVNSSKTINIDGVGSAPLVKYGANATGTSEIVEYDVIKGRNYFFRYDGTSFVLVNQHDGGFIRKTVLLSVAGTVTLTNDSQQFQFINVDSTNRDVVLPAVSTFNPHFYITNTSTTTGIITVKDAGATVIGSIKPGDSSGFVSSGTKWFLDTKDTEDVITAKGDFIIGSATGTAVRLPVSANANHVIKANASAANGLEWAQLAHSNLSGVANYTHAMIDTHMGDNTQANYAWNKVHVPTFSAGAGEIIASNAGNIAVTVTKGTDGNVLLANSSATAGVSWGKTSHANLSDLPVATPTAWNQLHFPALVAKGDMIAATTGLLPGVLTAGTNGQTLIANSSATLGVNWGSVAHANLSDSGGTVWNKLHFPTFTALGQVVSSNAANAPVATALGANGTVLMANTGATGGLSWTDYLKPRSTAIDSIATITANCATTDIYTVYALALSSCTLALPIGTPYDGQKLIIRITPTIDCNTFTSSAITKQFISIPGALAANKTVYIGLIYNFHGGSITANSFWECIAVTEEI